MSRPNLADWFAELRDLAGERSTIGCPSSSRRQSGQAWSLKQAVGEMGASTEKEHFKDQTLDSRVVGFWLGQARAAGLSAALAHSAGGNIYPSDRSGLTPTGRVIAAA